MMNTHKSWEPTRFEEDGEHYYCSPAHGLDDIILGGSDAEESPQEIQRKRARYEVQAKRYMGGCLPALQSVSLKGPFERDWRNPWRFQRRQPKDFKKTDTLMEQSDKLGAVQVAGNSTDRGLGYLNPAEARAWCEEAANIEELADTEGTYDTHTASAFVDDSFRLDANCMRSMARSNLGSDHPLPWAHSGRTATNTKRGAKRAVDSHWSKGSYASKRARWDDPAVSTPILFPTVNSAGTSKRAASHGVGNPRYPQGPSRIASPPQSLQTPEYLALGRYKIEDILNGNGLLPSQVHSPFVVDLNRKLPFPGKSTRLQQENFGDELHDEPQHSISATSFTFAASVKPRHFRDEEEPKKESSRLLVTTGRIEPLNENKAATISQVSALRPLRDPHRKLNISNIQQEDSESYEDASFVTEIAPSCRDLEKFQYRKRNNPKKLIVMPTPMNLKREDQQPLLVVPSEEASHNITSPKREASIEDLRSSPPGSEDQWETTFEETNTEIVRDEAASAIVFPTVTHDKTPRSKTKMNGVLAEGSTPPSGGIEWHRQWDTIDNLVGCSFEPSASIRKPVASETPPVDLRPRSTTPIAVSHEASDLAMSSATNTSTSIEGSSDPYSSSTKSTILRRPLCQTTNSIVPKSASIKDNTFNLTGSHMRTAKLVESVETHISQHSFPFSSATPSSKLCTTTKNPVLILIENDNFDPIISDGTLGDIAQIFGSSGKTSQLNPPDQVFGSPVQFVPPLKSQIRASSLDPNDISTQSCNTTPARSMRTPNLVSSSFNRTKSSLRGSTDNPVTIPEEELIFDTNSESPSEFAEDKMGLNQKAISQSFSGVSTDDSPDIRTTDVTLVKFDMGDVQDDVSHKVKVIELKEGTPSTNKHLISMDVRETDIRQDKYSMTSPHNMHIHAANPKYQSTPQQKSHPGQSPFNAHLFATRGSQILHQSPFDGVKQSGFVVDTPQSPEAQPEESWQGCVTQSPWGAEIKSYPQTSFDVDSGPPNSESTAELTPQTEWQSFDVSVMPVNGRLKLLNSPKPYATPVIPKGRQGQIIDADGTMSTQILVEAATNNPWTSSMRKVNTAASKKRVSWGIASSDKKQLSHAEPFEDTPSSSRSFGSPPPFETPLYSRKNFKFDDGKTMVSSFNGHFIAAGTFRRILPDKSASQLNSSPAPVSAMAEAFIDADQDATRKPQRQTAVGRSWRQEDRIEDVSVTDHLSRRSNEQQMVVARSSICQNDTGNNVSVSDTFGYQPDATNTNFDMDAALEELGDFLGDWSVETEMKKAEEINVRESERNDPKRRRLFGFI